MSWIEAFEDEAEARARRAERQRREQREEQLRRGERAASQRREDELARAVSAPGLERALDRAAERLVRMRIDKLSEKIGESLAEQVRLGVREAFCETDRRGHRSRIVDCPDRIGEDCVVRHMTIELPAVSYRVYQVAGTWEWVG